MSMGREESLNYNQMRMEREAAESRKSECEACLAVARREYKKISGNRLKKASGARDIVQAIEKRLATMALVLLLISVSGCSAWRLRTPEFKTGPQTNSIGEVWYPPK